MSAIFYGILIILLIIFVVCAINNGSDIPGTPYPKNGKPWGGAITYSIFAFIDLVVIVLCAIFS